MGVYTFSLVEGGFSRWAVGSLWELSVLVLLVLVLVPVNTASIEKKLCKGTKGVKKNFLAEASSYIVLANESFSWQVATVLPYY